MKTQKIPIIGIILVATLCTTATDRDLFAGCVCDIALRKRTGVLRDGPLSDAGLAKMTIGMPALSALECNSQPS